MKFRRIQGSEEMENAYRNRVVRMWCCVWLCVCAGFFGTQVNALTCRDGYTLFCGSASPFSVPGVYSDYCAARLFMTNGFSDPDCPDRYCTCLSTIERISSCSDDRNNQTYDYPNLAAVPDGDFCAAPVVEPPQFQIERRKCYYVDAGVSGSEGSETTVGHVCQDTLDDLCEADDTCECTGIKYGDRVDLPVDGYFERSDGPSAEGGDLCVGVMNALGLTDYDYALLNGYYEDVVVPVGEEPGADTGPDTVGDPFEIGDEDADAGDVWEVGQPDVDEFNPDDFDALPDLVEPGNSPDEQQRFRSEYAGLERLLALTAQIRDDQRSIALTEQERYEAITEGAADTFREAESSAPDREGIEAEAGGSPAELAGLDAVSAPASFTPCWRSDAVVFGETLAADADVVDTVSYNVSARYFEMQRTFADSELAAFMCENLAFTTTQADPTDICFNWKLPSALDDVNAFRSSSPGVDSNFQGWDVDRATAADSTATMCVYGSGAPVWSNLLMNTLGTVMVLLSTLQAARVVVGA